MSTRQSSRFGLRISLLLLLLSSPVSAQQFTTDWDWNDNSHLWLSRAVVAEAGWTNVDDHIAIANVLKRRLPKMKATEGWEGATFVDMVRAYCAGMTRHNAKFSRRATWVRDLPYEMPATSPGLQSELATGGWAAVAYAAPRPNKWPWNLPWNIYMSYWNTVLQRMQDWQDGKYRDKCPEAVHWGATSGVDKMNALEGGWIEVDCGDTRNAFYKLPD